MRITKVGIPSGGTTSQVLVKNSNTDYDVTWGAGGGGGTPGGSNTEVQFNDSGSFNGDSGFTYNKTTNTATIEKLNITSSIGGDAFNQSTASVGGRLYLFNAY